MLSDATLLVNSRASRFGAIRRLGYARLRDGEFVVVGTRWTWLQGTQGTQGLTLVLEFDPTFEDVDELERRFVKVRSA